MLFSGLSAVGRVAYLSILIGQLEISFARGPLDDQRGIGRVAREIYNQLKNLSERSDTWVERAEVDEGRRSVHFFASIHWCPDILPLRSVVMIHDVIPLLFSDQFPRAVVEEWHSRYKPIARQADLVVTISESSAATISELLDVPRNRIRVIHNGVTALPISDGRRVRLPRGEYVVFLGSYDFHKNLDVVLRALGDARLRNLSLVMVGDNKSARRRVRRSGLAKRVHFLGSLSDADVGYVMSNAVALVFPSMYEGFGLPPLEAGLLGVPSICSKRPAMNELLEGVALFAEPNSPGEWAVSLTRLLCDREFRKKLGELAQQRAGEFTWETSARALVDSLAELA